MAINLQGNNNNLQGSFSPLQGAPITAVQPAGTPQPAVTPQQAITVPTAKPVSVTAPITPRASAPAPQPSMVDLSGNYGLVNGTVYRKRDNFAFSDPQSFFRDAGISSFNNLKFDTTYQPQPAQTFGFGDGKTYDINGQPINASQPEKPQGVSPVPTTPPAIPAPSANQARIDELTKTVFQAPTVNQQKLYEDAYNSAGLANIRTKLTELNDLIATKLSAYTAKEADINENPFLSEASRIGRLNRLAERKQDEIGNLQTQYKAYADLYNDGIGEVNDAVARQVADFDTSRKISTEELSFLLGIEGAEADRQTEAQKTATTFAEKNNIVSRFYKYPGNDTVYDTMTGQPLSFEEYKALGGAGNEGSAFPDVQTLQSELKTISEGQSLYDPTTGQIIRTIPKTYKPTGGGYTGGSGQVSPEAQAVLNGTLKLEDLTPTKRGQIASELNQAGYKRTENLNATQRESIDGFDTLLREAGNAEVLVDKVNTGVLAGRTGAISAKLGFGSQDFINYNSSVSNLSSILLKLRSGAAVTPQEYDRIVGYIPTITEDEKTAKTKIKRFIEETQAALQNYIKRATQTSGQIAKEGATPQTGGADVNLNDLF